MFESIEKKILIVFKMRRGVDKERRENQKKGEERIVLISYL
jgi:hypothetical protein